MNPGDVIDHRYRLEEQIGSGGMSEVWRAQDSRLSRHVALKFLAARFSNDPDNLVRFFSEAQSLARIQHPNVVTVLDFGMVDNRPFLVMECITGGTLADLLGAPMNPRDAVQIMQTVAGAAGAAHSLGITHRDIKPGNILIEDGRPKLADFGIASYSGAERLTLTGLAVGSPNYISPEQATDRPTTARSDVYSLGIVLYEMLTGRRPFHSRSLPAILIAHVEEPPPRPTTYVSELPSELDTLVMKCLEKDPARRFADGNDLAAALSSVAQAASVTAVGPAADLPSASEAGSAPSDGDTAGIEVPASAGAADRSHGSSETNLRRAGARAVLAASIAIAAVATFLMLGLRPEGTVRDEVTESLPRRSAPGDVRPTDARDESTQAEIAEQQSASPSPSPTEESTPGRDEHGSSDDADVPGESGGEDEASPTPSSSPTPEPSPTASPDFTRGGTTSETVAAES